MKYTIFFLLFLFCVVSTTFAHDAGEETSKGVIDFLLHLIVFGGLGVAGIFGLRENKKKTGRYFIWYRG